MKNFQILFLAVFLMLSVKLIAQTNDEMLEDNNLIQFSGVVVTGDSLMPVPFANIMVKNTSRGTTSDYYGYFSFVAKKLDTIVFTSIGYRKSLFVVPDTLEANRYSLIQTMRRDTVMLEEVVIHPWPTQDQFKDAFLNLNIPDDDLEIAKKNLSDEVMDEKFASMPMTAKMNFKLQMQERSYQIYSAGQYRPITLFDPLAWAKFIEAWKRGDFKRKD